MWNGPRTGFFAAAFVLLPALAAADPPAPPRPSPTPASTASAPLGKKATAADRAAARALAEEGFEKLQQRQLDEAIALFDKAEERFHAPTHYVYLAQAFDKKGQLLKAAETYRKVLAETLARDAPEPFRDAQTEAASALEALLRRIPKLRVEATGVAPEQARLSIADRTVLSGASSSLDPGTYVVRAAADGVVPIERSVDLRDGGGEVVVRFSLARPTTLGWPIAAFGVGVAAGIVAIGTGVRSGDEGREADASCLKLVECPEETERKNADAQELRKVSIATGVIAGLALAGGLTLLLLRPSNKAVVEPAGAASAPAPAARRGPLPLATLTVRAGPGFTGFVGTF